MPPRRLEATLRSGVIVFALATGFLALATRAYAIKWHHCPSQVAAYPSEQGAISAPFIHPGHELAIFLSDREVRESGGFPIDADSTVRITLASLFGSPVPLEPMAVRALSPSAIFFTFPDTRETVGRPLAGPADVWVTYGHQTLAHILPRHLIALPPAVDVSQAADGGPLNAYATIDGNGDLWMPVSFSAYGPMAKPMPMCPGVFIPITAVNVGITVRSVPTSVGGGSEPTYPYLRALKRVELYMGDFVVNGYNAYGASVGRLPVFRIPRGWGIKVCGLNDAAEFVMKARGWRRWGRAPWSPFSATMANSTPLAIEFRTATTDPDVMHRPGGLDAFGQECFLE